FGQSYNRYMYVLGNPTGYTDPTGYDAVYDAQRRAESEYMMRKMGTDRNGGGGSESGVGSAVDDMQLEMLNEMMKQSMEEAQEAEEKQEQRKTELVQAVKSTGVSEGAAKAIVNAHAQRVAQGSASRDIMISGTQKQQTANATAGRSATTNSGLLADNGASNGQTATDAPRYGERDGPQSQAGKPFSKAESQQTQPQATLTIVGRSTGGHGKDRSAEQHLGVVISTEQSGGHREFLAQGGPSGKNLDGRVLPMDNAREAFSNAIGANWDNSKEVVHLDVTTYGTFDIKGPVDLYRLESAAAAVNYKFSSSRYNYDNGPNSNTWVKAFAAELGIKPTIQTNGKVRGW
ncbi:MAG: hypothetical protein SF187_11965, partial [Deltaproteobacteria bacterium]|nr:hypothetical protein [Deltaproteobacteria bacterium]